MDRTQQNIRLSGGGSHSPSASPTAAPRANVPSINIGGSPASPGSPMGDLLGRSLDIKKQLSQSLHGHSSGSTGHTGSGGGVQKPKSRRNSAYHVKTEEWETGSDNKKEHRDETKEEQGVERKRRDNINDKIQELLTLIPGEYFTDKDAPGNPGTGTGTTATNPGNSGADNPAEDAAAMAKAAGTRDGKPNKGQILTQAVEYIQHLQNAIDENNRKEVELFWKKRALENVASDSISSNGAPVPPAAAAAAEPTSAELALGEIGVGPESDAYFRRVLREYSGAFKAEGEA